jgi:tetratricopeptide (TPR) repeat protein
MMRKHWLRICLLIVVPFFTNAQQVSIDSLVHEANNTQNDTIRLIRLKTIARAYAELNFDSSYHYAELSLALARKLKLRLDEGSSLQQMGYAYVNKGNYPRSLQILLSAIAILDDPRAEQNVVVGKFSGDDELMYRTASPHLQRLSAYAFTQLSLGILYTNAKNYEKALHYEKLAEQKAVESGNLAVQSIANLLMNPVYLNLQKNDSALVCIKRSHELVMQSGYKLYLGSVFFNMGRTYAALGNVPLANEYYRRSILVSTEQGYFRGIASQRSFAGRLLHGLPVKRTLFFFT